jgi:hypothetical protein
VDLAEAEVAAGAGGDLFGVAEVAQEVLAAAGREVRVGFDVPDLGVRGRGAAFEAEAMSLRLSSSREVALSLTSTKAPRGTTSAMPSTIIL